MSGKKCPNCGACKECGAHPPQIVPMPYPYPVYPVYPPYPQPMNPWTRPYQGPTWISQPTITCDANNVSSPRGQYQNINSSLH